LIELASRGLPVVGVATNQFDRFSRQVLQQRGAADLPLAVIEHPLGGIAESEARSRAGSDVIATVVRALTEADPAVPATP